MVAGYGPPHPNVGKSEVLDFSNDSNLHCQDWSPLPEKTVGATGAFFQNHHLALICGARMDQDVGQDECYTVNDSSTTLFTKMLIGRGNAASIVVSKEGHTYLWITGGQIDTGLATATTELIDIENGLSRQGSEMPIPLANHDIVAFSDSVFIITGGLSPPSNSAAAVNKTFVYYLESDIWENGLSFNEARRDHSSGIVTDTSTFEKILVVAGGKGRTGVLDSVELLYFEGQDEEQWVYG